MALIKTLIFETDGDLNLATRYRDAASRPGIVTRHRDAASQHAPADMHRILWRKSQLLSTRLSGTAIMSMEYLELKSAQNLSQESVNKE